MELTKTPGKNVGPFICNTGLAQCHRFNFLSSIYSQLSRRTHRFCYLIQYNKQSAGMLLTTIVLLWLLLGYFIKISLKKTGYFCHNYFCLSIKNLLVAPAKIKKLSKLTHGRLKNPNFQIADLRTLHCACALHL